MSALVIAAAMTSFASAMAAARSSARPAKCRCSVVRLTPAAVATWASGAAWSWARTETAASRIAWRVRVRVPGCRLASLVLDIVTPLPLLASSLSLYVTLMLHLGSPVSLPHGRRGSGGRFVEAQVGAAEDAVWLRMPDRRVEPRARWWWTIRAAIRVAIIVAGMAAAYLWVEPLRPWLGLPIQIATVLGLIYIAAMPPWRYAVHRWETTDEAVYARTGWYVREWRVAPISRIQTVDTNQGPIEQ